MFYISNINANNIYIIQNVIPNVACDDTSRCVRKEERKEVGYRDALSSKRPKMRDHGMGDGHRSLLREGYRNAPAYIYKGHDGILYSIPSMSLLFFIFILHVIIQ